MRPTRHVIAIVVLASAMAAEGALSAAPAVTPPVADGTRAERFVERLSAGLHRTIAAHRLFAARRTPSVVPPLADDAPALPSSIASARRALSPCQFRLPPPTL